MLYDKGKRAKKSEDKKYEKARKLMTDKLQNVTKVGSRVMTDEDKSQMAIYQRPDTPLASTPEPKIIN